MENIKIECEEKNLKDLIFIRGRDLRNTVTNKNCLQSRTYDDATPAFQAYMDDRTSSATCASLACGYEDNALRATGENVIVAISIRDNDNVETQCVASLRRTVDNQNHKNHINHSSDKRNDNHHVSARLTTNRLSLIIILMVLCMGTFCSGRLQAQVTANNDTLYIGKGGVYEINVLANDVGANLQQPEILTQPVDGIVINTVGNKLAFTPNSGYDGTGSFTYRVCDNQNNCATAIVTIVKMPDNFIFESACAAAVPITTWSIKEAWKQSVATSWDDHLTPSVGDLDGDGVAEVVNFSGSQTNYNFQSVALQVRRGTDGLLLASYSCYTSHNGINMPTLVDLNKDGKGEILVYNSSLNLIALTFTRTSATSGTLTLFKTSSIALTQDVANSYNVGAYDFNRDGRTEVLVGPYIFNDDLVLIAQNSNVTAGIGFTSQCNSRKAIAADIDNDGDLEIIAGCYTYKVNISNPDASSGNSITQLAYSGYPDGFAAVADIDSDGDLDVVVVGTTQTYVWDGATNAFMGGETHSTGYWVSVPLVADVDNDGQLEIIYNRSNATQCLRYNNGANLSKPWSVSSSDIGGGTYMTAFDFNNDGASEMVYREDGGLHIIDGVTRQRTTIALQAGTLTDGPVIADADGDGEAEILVMGRTGSTYIYCYKSNGQSWLYARPVWNQYMYSGVHINDNLTVPSHPINPAQLVFPSGKRPLNNFLQQHSLLNINGGGLVSVSLLPDLTILSAKILSLTSSQLTVEVKVLNLENAVALANIPVSLSARNGNNYVFINSQNITTNIAPGTTATVTLVYDITGYTVDACKLTVNANSAVFPNNSLQEECNYTNNTFEFLSAFDDNLTTSCQSMPDTINVLDNDILPSTCPLPLVEIVSKPAHVTASLKDNKIIYSSSQSGLDTIVYRVICGTDSAEAKVYITVGASGSAFVDDVWYFGENIVSGGKSAGIRFVKNANEEYEAQDASGESWVSTWENSLVVSSPYCDGQNIFYANHSQLYNSLHDTLKNGAFIGHKSTCDGLAACYMGDNKYLFFTVTNVSDANGAYPRGINAYVVDMNADNGRGELTDTIIVEPEHKHMSEFLELVARAGTSDQYWLIYAHCNGNCTEDNYYNNELRVRLVNVSNPDAPQVAPVSATISKSKGGTFCMATSQQQNRIAVTDYITGIVSIFDFDNVVGTLTLRYNITGLTSGYVYGIEFSPDGNQLYFASYNGSNARLYQYDISGATPVQVIGSPLKYWQTTAGEKGGGLKLGPDGKVYITLANSNKVGAISEPNATTDLVLRYNANALTLGITYNGLAFSAGLTKPAIMSCDMNTPPTTQADSTTLCVTSTSTKVNVLVNDDDADPNDTVYLTSAEFVNASDADLATLTVNAVDSTITLTVKPNVNIAAGHVFEILYNIKDDGLPASQCATGILKITTYPTPNYPDIRVRVCPDLGKSINLSKYIDAFNVTYLKWESISPVIPITDPTASGTIMTDDLNVYMRVHTFEYTVGNLCASSNIRRKVYLETLKQGKMRALRDSIVICYERAEAVNINQIFGIDACGTWSFEAFESDCFTPVNNIDAYITESTSPAYGGAVIMNGKAIYKNTSARKILITYTPADDSCLAGRAFTIKIVLTEN